MENIGNRIKVLRSHLNLNQTEFGAPIGLKQAAIGLYENGERTVSTQSIILICEKYNVNETWLRTGEGNIFTELPPEDEVAAAVSGILEDIHCENSFYNTIKEFLVQYERLDSDAKKHVDKYFDDVFNGLIEKKEGN